MQVSPSGMASASQADSGEFDSRHLLQKRRLPHGGVLFWRKTTISLLGSLVQRELAAIWQTEGLAVSVSELLIPSVTP